MTSYSMIARVGGNVSVHRLVQAVTRNAAGTPDRQGADLNTSLHLLLTATPNDPLANVDGWPTWRVLLPHIEAAAALLSQQHNNTYVFSLRDGAAAFRHGQGQFASAIDLVEAILTDMQRVLGLDHLDTLGTRNNLALLYQAAGDMDRAIPLLDATLTDVQRILGPNHRRTLLSRENLASAYQDAGDLDTAIPTLESVLADMRRVLGLGDHATLGTQNDLALAYQSAGQLDKAMPLYEACFADAQRFLGPNHPDTLSSCHNLALAYQSAGDPDKAIPLYEACLADRQRLLGPDHPDTLVTSINLAYTYESAGQMDRAVPLLEATLADAERALGPDHPVTIHAQTNLDAATAEKDSPVPPPSQTSNLSQPPQPARHPKAHRRGATRSSSGPAGTTPHSECQGSGRSPVRRSLDLPVGGQQNFWCPPAGTQLSVSKDFSASASTELGLPRGTDVPDQWTA
jgi:tetratricopeptide (TPR) repeat protein